MLPLPTLRTRRRLQSPSGARARVCVLFFFRGAETHPVRNARRPGEGGALAKAGGLRRTPPFAVSRGQGRPVSPTSPARSPPFLPTSLLPPRPRSALQSVFNWKGAVRGFLRPSPFLKKDLSPRQTRSLGTTSVSLVEPRFIGPVGASWKEGAWTVVSVTLWKVPESIAIEGLVQAGIGQRGTEPTCTLQDDGLSWCQVNDRNEAGDLGSSGNRGSFDSR